MTYLLQVVVGFLMICMAFGPQSLWASFGPCAFVTESRIESTITCTNGVCTGNEYVYPRQTACMNTDETPCSQNDNGTSCFVYEPRLTTTNYTAQYLTYAGVGGACATCVEALIAATGGSGVMLINVTCGAACAAAIASIDPCWFATCERDWTIMPSVRLGGSECQ